MDLNSALTTASELRAFFDRAGSAPATRVIEVDTLREAELLLELCKDERVLTAMSINGRPVVKSNGRPFDDFHDPGGPLAFVVPRATLPHLLGDEALRRRLRPEAAIAEKRPGSAGRRIDRGIIVLIVIVAAAVPLMIYRHAQQKKERAAAEARAEAEYARMTPPKDVGLLNYHASYKGEPVVPPAAKAAGIRGDVVVAFLIDENGVPMTVEAISGPPELREAALAAARQAHFYKLSESGHYLRRKGTLTYHFP
jgi:TonB family protein